MSRLARLSGAHAGEPKTSDKVLETVIFKFNFLLHASISFTIYQNTKNVAAYYRRITCEVKLAYR